MSRLRMLTLLRLAIAVHAFVVPLFYELPVPGLRLTSNDLLSALILLSWGAWAGYRLLARRDRAPAAMALGPLFPATAVFALSHVLSTAVARDTFVAIRETTKTLGILFFLLVAQGLIADPADRRRLAWAATLGAAVASLLAIAESFSWRGSWAYLALRPSATTGNPNTLGAYLAALLPVGFALIMGSGVKLSDASGMVGRTARALVTSLAVLLTTLIALALLLTLSRGSWISAVAAALAWVAVAGRSLRRGLRSRTVPGMIPGLTAAAGVILGVVVVVASVVPAPALDRARATIAARARSLTSLESSSDGVRIVLVQASWRMFQEHPLFGVGPGNFATEVDEVAPRVVSDQDRVLLPRVTALEFPHNWPAQIAAENGLLG
ncbi:MAG: O-antigen ligase family protein, partial [Bacillota bacterium]